MANHTWRSLNKKLNTLSESEVLELLEHEKKTENRLTVLTRLHQRYNTLRVARERLELLINAHDDRKINDVSLKPKVQITSFSLPSYSFTLAQPSILKLQIPNQVPSAKTTNQLNRLVIDFIKALVANRDGLFQFGIVGSPFHKICEILSRRSPDRLRVKPKELLQALYEAEWIDRGRIKSREFSSKRHVFIHPENSHLSNSQLIRLLEQNST